MYREYSGGMIAELMSHQFDFINWVTGTNSAFISGQGGIDHYKDGRETFDNVHLQAQYINGHDATFSCTITKWSQSEGVTIDADGSDPTRQALIHFRDAINTGQQPESDVKTGALAAKCVDLCLQAAIGAKTVQWA